MTDTATEEDEFEPLELNDITDYVAGDEIRVRGVLYEIMTITASSTGLLFRMTREDHEREHLFVCSSPTHQQRGRFLKANHP